MLTYLIIGITGVVSFIAFQRRDIFNQLKFNAYDIKHFKKYYRFLSYGLVHADWMHLIINMFVLYSFGGIVSQFFDFHFGAKGNVYFILLYIGGLGFSTLYDFGKYKDDPYYNAVGASGAVAAVVFASILLYPAGKIFLFFIPIGIPAPIFGILYLFYSVYMGKKGTDNIGHNAHFFGAIYGLIFTIAIKPEFVTMFIQYYLG